MKIGMSSFAVLTNEKHVCKMHPPLRHAMDVRERSYSKQLCSAPNMSPATNTLETVHRKHSRDLQVQVRLHHYSQDQQKKVMS